MLIKDIMMTGSRQKYTGHGADRSGSLHSCREKRIAQITDAILYKVESPKPKNTHMKILLLSFVIAIFSCESSKKTVEATPEGSKVVLDSLPVCVKVLIEKMKSEPVTNPPSKVYSYLYKGKKVYYVPPVCCDMFSDLYNDSCRLMGHPDGGFTGRGDGKFSDFDTAKKHEKILWEDTRKK